MAKTISSINSNHNVLVSDINSISNHLGDIDLLSNGDSDMVQAINSLKLSNDNRDSDNTVAFSNINSNIDSLDLYTKSSIDSSYTDLSGQITSLDNSIQTTINNTFDSSEPETITIPLGYLSNQAKLPVGAIFTFGKTIPPGFLYCNGTTFDPIQYPELYAYLGSNVLPDYRGIFFRGFDDGRGFDHPSRALGVIQYATRVIKNWYAELAGRDVIADGGFDLAADNWEENTVETVYYANETQWTGSNGGIKTAVSTAMRVRPINMNVLRAIVAR